MLRVSSDGQVASKAAAASGTGDGWGFSSGPIAAGDWTYALTDVGGNILAQGTITAQ